VREIPLTRGMVALVDDEDYEEVAALRWHALRKKNGWYAQANIRDGSRRTTVEMQVFLMGKPPEGKQRDHVNGNGLDNRRRNLRWATSIEQAQNRRRQRNAAPGFKGIRRVDGGTRWQARIETPTGRVSLGTFASQEEAAQAYDAKAKEVFGAFARLNFPNDVMPPAGVCVPPVKDTRS
jgi:hypothetical protein